MLFIISPAKKMNVVDGAFPWRDLPVFVDRAEELACAVRALDYNQAKALWACSDALAALNFERFRTMDMRDEGRLTPAVLAYEGIQYQHLAPGVMTCDQLVYVQHHLRILSGLYGVLRPLDGVVPYRLEMQAKLPVAGARNLYGYWGDSLYRLLAHELQEQRASGASGCEPTGGHEEDNVVVNVASAEYAKAVIPFAQRARKDHDSRAVQVVTCVFGSVDAEGKVVQRSTAAKAARGSFVRWCAEHAARRVADLRAFDSLGYRFDPSRSTKDRLVFTC